MEFKTSSYCGGGACVAVANTTDDLIVVTNMSNGKILPGVMSLFTRPEWEDFIAGVKAGEFDFPLAKTTPKD